MSSCLVMTFASSTVLSIAELQRYYVESHSLSRHLQIPDTATG